MNSDYGQTKKIFSQIPKNLIEKLYHVFKIDFDMFGIAYPANYIKMGK